MKKWFSVCVRYLGNLTVWFDQQGEVVDWDGNPILLDYSVEEGRSYTNLFLCYYASLRIARFFLDSRKSAIHGEITG